MARQVYKAQNLAVQFTDGTGRVVAQVQIDDADLERLAAPSAFGTGALLVQGTIAGTPIQWYVPQFSIPDTSKES